MSFLIEWPSEYPVQWTKIAVHPGTSWCNYRTLGLEEKDDPTSFQRGKNKYHGPRIRMTLDFLAKTLGKIIN